MRGERFKPCKKSVFALGKGKKKTVAPPPVEEEVQEEGESAGEDQMDDSAEDKVDPSKSSTQQSANVMLETEPSVNSTVREKGEKDETVVELSDSDIDFDATSREPNESVVSNHTESQKPNSITTDVGDQAFVESEEREPAIVSGQECTPILISEGESDTETENESEESVDEESEDITARTKIANSAKDNRPKTSPGSLGTWLTSSRKPCEGNRDFGIKGEKYILHSRSEDYFANLASSLPPSSKPTRENTFHMLTEDELDRVTIGKRPASVPSNARLGVEPVTKPEKQTFLAEPIPEVPNEEAAVPKLHSGLEMIATSSVSLNPQMLLPAFDKISIVPEAGDAETGVSNSLREKDATILDLESDDEEGVESSGAEEEAAENPPRDAAETDKKPSEKGAE